MGAQSVLSLARPGFPSGLRVLLVDGDAAARARTEEQLRECSYVVTSCASCAEAIVQLNACPSPAFDVLLADKSAIGCGAPSAADPAAVPAPAAAARSGLLESIKGLPCILMGSDPSPKDIMQGISLGAVDFLAKPLSQLKLRNIWQHTVRKMMADMRICTGKAAAAAAKPPQQAAPPSLDRTASNMLPELLASDDAQHQENHQQQQHEQAAAPAPSAPAAAMKAPSGLPPRSPGRARSPPIRVRRTSGTGQRSLLHACISSTNLAASGPEVAMEDEEFDFDAAEAACAAAGSPAEAIAPSPSYGTAATAKRAPGATAAPAMSSGTTATATATHASVPAPSCAAAAAPSCGVPVPGALAPLNPGMVWGMPMPVVRAPGIVPPKNAAPPMPPAAAAAPAAWGYMMAPPFMMPPPFMMMPHPSMCISACGPAGYGAMCYGAPAPQYPGAAPCYAQPAPMQQHHAPALAPTTGAAVAQALDASLMSLLGSAEDDLDVDLDDVLQDLGAADGTGAGAPAAAQAGGAIERSPSPASDGFCCGGADSSVATDSSGCCDEGASFGSSNGALPCVGGAGDMADDFDLFLGACGGAGGVAGGLGVCGAMGLEDWADEHLHMKKSTSLADLLAEPLAVA